MSAMLAMVEIMENDRSTDSEGPASWVIALRMK